MMAVLLASFSLMGTSFSEQRLDADQRTDYLVERCGISLIDGGGSRRHGAVVTLRPTHRDGLAQEGDAVWRRGGIDGS